MLQIKNLTIKDLKNHILIENFNYSLGNNDKVGIIGEEGNGKSTLLKAIKDKILIEDYTVIEGDIVTDFQNIAYFEQHIHPKWKDVQLYEYLLKKDVEDEIEPHQYNELLAYEKMCQRLFLPGDFIQRNQCVGSLSGGEKVKLQLLKLMHEPMDLLLLDEPTNDLDMETLKWLEQFIKSLTIPVMFISHDETLLEECADVLIHLEQLNKKTKAKANIYRGKYSTYVEERYQKREKELQIAHKEKQEYMKKKIRLNDQMNAVHDALNDTVRNPGQARLLKKKMKNIKALERRFDTESYSHVDSVEEAIDVYFPPCGLPATKVILDTMIKDIQIENKVLIYDVPLQIYGKDKIVITGNNGCGKSVLMKQIYQLLQNRQDIRLCYMPQNYADLFHPDDTPVSFLTEEGDWEEITMVRELLGRMKFTRDEMEHCVHELSEGQKAKLYLIQAIKKKSNVLLLDEPTRNLSPLTNPTIRRILSTFDGCIIAVSHDRKLIQEVFHRQYCIQEKHIQIKEIK